MIEQEIKNAKAGKEAFIILKLNNLVDNEVVRKLYKASNAGVKIKMIIRGICSVVPGVQGMSENIEVISILDRYLEHSRILVFANGGDEKYFISSADWMGRNLDRRIEVGVPIHNKAIQKELRKVLEFQLNDNCKARVIDKKQRNEYKKDDSTVEIRSQYVTHNFYKEKYQKANNSQSTTSEIKQFS